MKVLVLGASGMLGNAMYNILADMPALEVFGSVRTDKATEYFSPNLKANLITNIDVTDKDAVMSLFAKIDPEVVINCIGLVKQLDVASIPVQAITINSLLPHQLANNCLEHGARLVHFSTDCIFSGKSGNYSEDDLPDARDLYGRSKLLGEVDYPNALTLRTSIIGHELDSTHGLIDWFLSQKGKIKGFTQAFFSGLPTYELARIMAEYVIPNKKLSGVYHVAATPISKFDLLELVNETYKAGIVIEPDNKLKIDRSLNGARFMEATGYKAPSWPELVANMVTNRPDFIQTDNS